MKNITFEYTIINVLTGIKQKLLSQDDFYRTMVNHNVDMNLWTLLNTRISY